MGLCLVAVILQHTKKKETHEIVHYSIYNLLQYEHVEMRCLYTSSFLLQEEVWSVQTTKEDGKDDTVTEELEFCQDRCVWL